jgi:hypothetical protein
MWHLLIEPVKSIIDGVRENKKQKRELKAARHKAQVARIRQGDEQAAAMDELSAQSRGWKDDYLLIITTAPLILCFFPSFVDDVTAGFTALESLPEYYMYLLAGVYIDTFGFRRILRNVLDKWLAKKFG